MTALAIEVATNKEIANQLFISVKTVARHSTSAYTKLGIRSGRTCGGPCRHLRSARVEADRLHSDFRDHIKIP